MSIVVACNECEKSFKVKDRYAGMAGACPFCGTMLQVPAVASAVAPDEGEFVHQEEKKSSASSTSSLSLMTRVPMKPCPCCNKDILVGSPSCFYCGASLGSEAEAEAEISPPAPPAPSTGDRVMLEHIQQVLAQEQARLRARPGERPAAVE
jgi:hypothetical protein